MLDNFFANNVILVVEIDGLIHHVSLINRASVNKSLLLIAPDIDSGFIANLS
ncbi:hypothetical protein [Shewanella saliphila]|uniref:Uncharacterized protein n=1 Tax=Shewanella saliphila TaxID=2282698 RepID=A0ABQ2Q401_9GAMM|nr:hypothetical protein [Shewanella saliphila]MCL1101097.1 hypothetical protein [Shewanella saliphila]GGP45816.1 hypothetical protein GCM10009409_10610 [Shewanella saliphila]